jgi:hypothetical protein
LEGGGKRGFLADENHSGGECFRKEGDPAMGDNERKEGCGMREEPQLQHRWLQKLIGDWTFEGEAKIEPDKPPERFRGTESVRSLGGLWILAEGQGEMPGGGAATTLMTLGYDPNGNRYVGTFVASMMTHLWVYEGALDATGEELVLDTEGPGTGAGAKRARFQDVIQIKTDDLRTLKSRTLGEDGQWHVLMEAAYRRRK